MAYIDGFVAAVPTGNKAVYTKHASDALVTFKKYGVTRMVENWGDDVPDGKVTDFKRAVQAKPEETVIFSWLEYPDKATRNAANEKMMGDPQMEAMSKDMPFDGKRMIYGGFEVVSDLGKGGKFGYVDATLIPIPASKIAEYSAWAKKVDQLFVDAGATRVVDAIGDDVPPGKVTDYYRAVNAADGEKIGFGWIEWPSKDVRDKAWAKIMESKEMEKLPMPYDGKRMIFGGFAPILDA